MNITSKALVLMMLLTISVTGCRFGNYSEKDKSTVSSKFLGMEPVAFFTAILYNDTDANGNQNIDFNDNTTLSGIPADARSTFTNPVQLIFLNDFTSAMFRSLDQNYSMSTQVNAKNEINYGENSNIVKLWSNPGCITQVQISQTGNIDPSKTDAYLDLEGKTQRTNGRLKYSLFYQRIIEGDCLDDLKLLAACYQNPTGPGCTQNTVESAVRLFHLYVFYGGVLNLDDATLARIRSFAYIVDFE